ncbi:MAG: hypothetical protein HZB87_07620 [Desulfatitalea sp.]|nr:hypothetical protein [Desulfatitalea sp.]
MRRTAYKFGVIAVILAALWICGCSSSSDPLDEMSWRYRMNLTVLDNGEESQEIDPTGEGAGSVQAVIESHPEFDQDLFVHEIYCDLTFDGDSLGSASVTERISYDGPRAWVSGNGGTLTINLLVFSAGDKQAIIDTYGEDYWADFSVDCTANGSYSSESDDDQISVEDSTWFTVITSATPTPTPAP